MRIAAMLILCALMTGCAASYVAPGRGAQLAMFGASEAEKAKNTDAGIQLAMDKKPLASFPAAIAVARVQAAGYASRTAQGWGTGQYTVVTSRDIEKEDDIERLAKLQMVHGVAPLSRLVLPASLQTDYELRQAAAKMHADMLLIYTLDTTFRDTNRTTPLSIVTLGATSIKRMRILCTASAAVLDTRSGYVYGLAEATESHEELQNALKREVEIDSARRAVEAKAFGELLDALEKTWGGVVREYATASRTGGTRYETDQR
jgi:hypothetical protein